MTDLENKIIGLKELIGLGFRLRIINKFCPSAHFADMAVTDKSVEHLELTIKQNGFKDGFMSISTTKEGTRLIKKCISQQ